MTGTRLFDVKDRIVTALSTAPSLSDIEVHWGWPKNPGRELIAFGTVDMQSEWASLGGSHASREERYEMDAALNVRVPGLTQRESDERAITLFKMVQDIFISNITLGGLVLFVEVVPSRFIPITTDEGCESQVDFMFRVRARI